MIKEKLPQFVSDNVCLKFKTFLRYTRGPRGSQIQRLSWKVRSSLQILIDFWKEVSKDQLDTDSWSSLKIKFLCTAFFGYPISTLTSASKSRYIGLHCSKDLSNPPVASHCWVPPVSCVICVTITNSHPIDFWRKELPPNYSLIFLNIQTSRKRRGKTHLWIELCAFCVASVVKNVGTFTPDSAVFTF